MVAKFFVLKECNYKIIFYVQKKIC